MRMKFVRTAAALVLLAAIICQPAAFAITRGYIETPSIDGSVFLRTGGGMNYPAIGYGMCDDPLVIHRIGSRWDRVTITAGVGYGKTGWMYNGYIRLLKNRDDITGWGAMARVKDYYADKGIKLYRGPGTRYGYKRTLYGDDQLIILSRYSSSWYKMQLGHTFVYGYVYRPRIINGVFGSVFESASLYKRASLTSPILDDIEAGDLLIVLNIGSRWSKVRYMGTVGYVQNYLVDIDSDIDYDDEGDEYDL